MSLATFPPQFCWVALSRLLLAALFLFGLNRSAIANDETLTFSPDKTEIVKKPAADKLTDAAASLLQVWLRKASRSDAGFEFASANQHIRDSAKIAIVLGDRPEPGLPADGFVLKRFGNEVRITGATPAGTFYGAVEFLHRLGIRFYMPTDLFTALPADANLKVGELDVTSKPYVQSLHLSGIDHDNVPSATWARINGAWRRKGGTHQHNSFEMFPPDRYAERAPEIYPILDGKRYIPKSLRDQSWQLNYAEPKLVELAMESIDLYFQNNPEDTYVALSIQDGSRFDEGPQTKEVIERFRATGDKSFKDRALSHLYWKFMAQVANRMQAKWPGKLLVGLAYGPTRFPPTEMLPDNVVPFTNFHIAELPLDGFLRAENGGNPTLGEWLKVASHYGNHDWYQGSGYLLPRFYSGYWSEFLQQVQSKVGDALMHVETYPNWGFDGPKYYVLCRLMWNPKEDPAAIMKQMCQDLFGPAGPTMNRYFALLENLWNQLGFKEGVERKLGNWRTQFQTTPDSRKMIVEARALLDQASKEAQDPLHKARIALFSDCFQISEYFISFAGAKSLDKEKLQEAIAFCTQALQDHQKMALMHPSNLIPALNELATFTLRASTEVIKPPYIEVSTFPPPSDDKSWGKTPAQSDFFLAAGDADIQKTTLQIGRDKENLYIKVTSPHLRQRASVETDDSNWRSDNIECKIDFDNNWNTAEAHFWIKTNGRLVDWGERDAKDPSPLKSSVVRQEQDTITIFQIPLGYLRAKGNLSSVGIQVLRNEFKEKEGANQLDYQAAWAKRLDLGD